MKVTIEGVRGGWFITDEDTCAVLQGTDKEVRTTLLDVLRHVHHSFGGNGKVILVEVEENEATEYVTPKQAECIAWEVAEKIIEGLISQRKTSHSCETP